MEPCSCKTNRETLQKVDKHRQLATRWPLEGTLEKCKSILNTFQRAPNSPQIEKTMQHFLSQYNVELIPENSGTENCKFEIFKLENTNAHNVELIPDNLGIENYRFKNAKLENTNAKFPIYG